MPPQADLCAPSDMSLNDSMMPSSTTCHGLFPNWPCLSEAFLASVPNISAHLQTFHNDLQPTCAIGLLLILFHGLSYASCSLSLLDTVNLLCLHFNL